MEQAIREAYDAQRNFGQKAFRSGCYAAFVSLHFTTLGEVLACCKNRTYVLGNVAGQRLPEIWNGRKITNLRRALNGYHFEAGCEFCEWQIAGGDYQGAYAANYEEFPVGSAEPEWPQIIEFAGSNHCNFECIMCSGENSSLIRSRREGLPPLPKVYSDQFFQDLRPFLPYLRQAKFLGGEPFLAQECFRIWDMILEDGLTTPCHVTTNASQYNARVERVLEALPVSLTLSVDGATKETVEKIRVNCDYEEYFRNIHRFREYTKRRGTYMSIAHCLMRDNWHEFGDVLLLAESLGCDVFVNTVVSPDHCSLYTLPPGELDRIVDEMERQGSRLEGKIPINRHVWEERLRNLRGDARGRLAGTLTQIQKTDGWGLVREGRLSEALEHASKITETHPQYYQSAILCAHIRRQMGDLEQAERDVNRAIQVSRRPFDALIERAWLRLEQSRFEEGIADVLRARELCDGNNRIDANVCTVLGFLYVYAGNLSEAKNALDELLVFKPADPEARVVRAHAFAAAGLRDDALREVETALALDANCTEATEFRELLLADTTPQ